MKIRIFLVLVAAFLLIPDPGLCVPVEWQSYREGIRLAKQQKKKVFLHFRTDWCGYCAKMDQETFSDPAVAAFLNERFVAIKVDGDREPSLAKAYKVTGYPDSRFLDRDMKGVFQLPGFVESPAFFFFLEYIHSDSYKTMDPMQYYKTR